MSTRNPPHDDRRLELLADRALHGLSEQEQAELRRILDESVGQGADDHSFDLAASMLDRAFGGARGATVPPEALASLKALGRGWVQSGPRVAGRIGAAGTTKASRAVVAAGWVAAAAALLLAAIGWFRGQPAGTAAPTASEARAAMLTQAGVLTGDWGDWDNPEIAGVKGDIVWDPGTQTGYMRFTGLPVNDPGTQQYQVWIVDERGLDRDGLSCRVSGGVFDGVGAGELIVPIRPSVRVGDVKLMAVTVEQAGGTVVSTMKRRVVVTAPTRARTQESSSDPECMVIGAVFGGVLGN